jgi:hypothetical protein
VQVIATTPTAGTKEARANIAIIEKWQPIDADGLLAVAAQKNLAVCATEPMLEVAAKHGVETGAVQRIKAAGLA